MGKQKRKGPSAFAKPHKAVKLSRTDQDAEITRTVLAALSQHRVQPDNPADQAAFQQKFGPGFIAKVKKLGGSKGKKLAAVKKRLPRSKRTRNK
jgi:hypothetical protein